MQTSKNSHPTVLCVLDGWGHSENIRYNAIASADTPIWDSLVKNYPHGLLKTSGIDVGLPEGQMGNSEVGHMNIGAGRIVLQDLPRIDAAIETGAIEGIPSLDNLIIQLRENSGTCHLMGLVSPGGVHAHVDHIVALIKILDSSGIKVILHGFLDGRDTPPSSALNYLEYLDKKLARTKSFKLGTLSGRYWAMDRDKRWDRVGKAYLAITDANGFCAEDAYTAIRSAYAKGVTDEFIEPIVLGDYQGMSDGDALMMANFRADRVRQILSAYLNPQFNGFIRTKKINFVTALGMTEYSDELNNMISALFPRITPKNVLGEEISKVGFKQLRLAETEKYAHVTFFLNGGREKVFQGEKRILIHSPKVRTYDLKPEMSAHEVTDNLVNAIIGKEFDLIVVNYANTDMVGHTGVFPAAVRAVETIDKCLGRMVEALHTTGGTALITADHGNAEQMFDVTENEHHTAHTINRVPIVLVNNHLKDTRLIDGKLADVAPTLLNLMGLAIPDGMTGQTLLRGNN